MYNVLEVMVMKKGRFTQANERLKELKKYETELELLSGLERLGIEIPKEGEIDIHKLLVENGQDELANAINLLVFNKR